MVDPQLRLAPIPKATLDINEALNFLNSARSAESKKQKLALEEQGLKAILLQKGLNIENGQIVPDSSLIDAQKARQEQLQQQEAAKIADLLRAFSGGGGAPQSVLPPSPGIQPTTQGVAPPSGGEVDVSRIEEALGGILGGPSQPNIQRGIFDAGSAAPVPPTAVESQQAGVSQQLRDLGIPQGPVTAPQAPESAQRILAPIAGGGTPADQVRALGALSQSGGGQFTEAQIQALSAAGVSSPEILRPFLSEAFKTPTQKEVERLTLSQARIKERKALRQESTEVQNEKRRERINQKLFRNEPITLGEQAFLFGKLPLDLFPEGSFQRKEAEQALKQGELKTELFKEQIATAKDKRLALKEKKGAPKEVKQGAKTAALTNRLRDLGRASVKGFVDFDSYLSDIDDSEDADSLLNNVVVPWMREAEKSGLAPEFIGIILNDEVMSKALQGIDDAWLNSILNFIGPDADAALETVVWINNQLLIGKFPSDQEIEEFLEKAE